MADFEAAVRAHEAGDFAAAEAGYQAFPGSTNSIENLGILYAEHDRWADAERAFRTILSQRPERATAEYGLAMVLLATRRYAEAWPHFEARRRLPLHNCSPPRTHAPEWMGGPLTGKRIAVCAEQGFGDQIMFGRWLPWLRATGVDVVVASSPPLAPFFAAAGYFSVDYAPGEALEGIDSWCLFGSLPLRLGMASPPAPILLPIWRGGEGVGVQAHGNRQNVNDRWRSLPPEAAAGLLAARRDLEIGATGAADFLAAAEILAGLDSVVTVDTATAHLAGAIGAPCSVLLPRIAMEWRWNDGVKSDWYPDHRLCRQSDPHQWEDAIRLALSDQAPARA